jgi:hypothetical protein
MPSGKLLAAAYLSINSFVSGKERIEIRAASRQPRPPCPLQAVRAPSGRTFW